MRRLFSLATSALLAASFASPVARAATPASGSITLDVTKITWQGAHFVDASTPSPEFCTVPDACDEFDVHVTLGDDYWAEHAGALQIGIQWKDETKAESESEYDTMDLYVYDSYGQVVASSTSPVASSMGIASSAQVVNIDQLPDGDYRVLVVPFSVADRAYHGVAMLQDFDVEREADRLPDLTALQPTNFKFEQGTYSFTRYSTDTHSCYAEETLQDEGHPTRCLRFDAGHANLGEGAFMLEVDLSTARPVVDQTTLGGEVRQIITRGDGTTYQVPAGEYVFHANHGHIHYRGFATYQLFTVNPDGSRGALASTSHKADFCMIDVDDLWFGLPGAQPRTRHFPQCNALEGFDDNGHAYQQQGIDRGWADVYTWDLPGQYIDATNVPDGVYDVVNTVNPAHVITESDTSNDEAAVRIRITGNTVTCLPAPYGCPAGTTSE